MFRKEVSEMARYVVVWTEVIGGVLHVYVDGTDRLDEAEELAKETGGVWFPASMADEVIQKIRFRADW